MNFQNENKKVKIIKQSDDLGFKCVYVQIYNELGQIQEQVLELKSYATEKRAISYAKKCLGI
ncbi:MAG TPA: hypothetical protein PLJ37_00835 [Chitinophagales bacterium]|nr:hypothetical protein [Chitinophagales bacterium]HMW93497.1 hypothetical protein [Chitinophagales bacterium]HMZ92880.1 hypothetical protein [Chitinophagales bacterium]HNG25931.1 hypothetical protein [Chitinophagales bacterium]